MKRIFLIFLLLFCVGSALAQEQKAPKASEKAIEVKPAPAEITIPAETVKALQVKADAAQMAALKAENLSLRISQAQAELKKLTEEAERAKDEANAAYQRAAIKAGIPGESVADYTGESQKDGSLRLTRKPSPPKQ